ncbi:MAG: hypothetical protein R2795_26155 [Saprospiraceae bacterium]
MFLPLTMEEIRQILRLLLRKTEKALNQKGMVLKVSERALDWLAVRGYDPQFGARPMKRVLQRDLVDGLSKEIISDTFVAGDTLYIDLGQDSLTFSKEPFDPSLRFTPPTSDTPEKKGRSRRSGKKKGNDLEELKKATDDLNEAVAATKTDE